MSKVKPDLVYEIKDSHRRYYHLLCYKINEHRHFDDINDPNDSGYINVDWEVEIKSQDSMRFSYKINLCLPEGKDPIGTGLARKFFNEFCMNLYDAISNSALLVEEGENYEWAMNYEIESVDK